MTLAQALVGHRDDHGIWRRIYHSDSRRAAPRPALFLDRDGTVIEASPYLSDPTLVRAIPDAVAVINHANRRDIPVVLVTNQSGIGRGYFDWTTYYAVEDAIATAVIAAGARIDAVYACPAVPSDPMPFGRKPDPGMLTTAAAELDIDLAASWIAGDSASDIEAGLRAQLLGGWLVPTGYGEQDAQKARLLATERFEVITGKSLSELAEFF